ncbi:phosphatidylinositol 3,4,5-trisphosphate 3-phosphatase TPTE2-like [Dromiciops gliroides]|uniref:phosphatidylinositol 3,4,5-trisphosphate 3-phosphatase TPTE2-like n=1 Tax=Dromiciops gliroides TaxID=33562 RepID=UPI001CC8030A|nr:phosphatidylinositol 3,4,5-trisphosphate 3-phosphatase TPTE2-like [Dromiciops gliroides]
MAEEKKGRETKDEKEKVGAEKAPGQEKVPFLSEKKLGEVSDDKQLRTSSFSAPFLPVSTSPSTTSRISPLPLPKSLEHATIPKRSKRDSFLRRSIRTINTGSNFISKDNFVGKTVDFDEEEELEKSHFKRAISSVVMSLTFRFFSILLIFIHIGVLIAALALTPKGTKLPLAYRILFLVFGLFFLADVLFQVFLEGVRTYFSSKINTIDLFSILLVLVLDMTYISFDIGKVSLIPKLTFVLKALRLFVLVKVFQLASEKRKIEKAARKLVSENKRRYKKDGFDLDLTYVTDNVIAMSFPSSGSRSLYRNPIKEVVRFLDMKHPDCYKIYNLCSERSYNHSYFHNRVERFPIDDHNVPTVIEMLKFVDSVFEWMEKDPKNIIVVHCMGGKGRTGTMICIWLIASERFDTAKESLEYFGKRRTDTATSTKFQGVETPSQSRYVEYFALIKNKYHWAIPQNKIFKIKSITIYSIRGVGKGNGKDLKIIIMMNKKTVYTCLCSSSKNCEVSFDDDKNSVNIRLNNCPDISGDVKIKFFYNSALPNLYEKCPFFFWFNTAFIENNRLYLHRNELDNPHKPKTWHVYREDFAVELLFLKT